MNSANSDEILAARAARLKSSKVVYQFQPTNDANDDRLSKLSTNKLWISDPAKFNDPLDLRLELKDLTNRGPFNDTQRLKEAFACLLKDNDDVRQHWFYDEELINTLRKWIEGRLPGGDSEENHLIFAIKKRIASFGVTCFSSEWQNTLMWSHYADQHNGFCIEYSVRPIHFACANPAFSQHHVHYVSELPTLCLSEALFAPHQLLGRMLATKHVDWAYEKEWRLVNYENKGQPVDMPKHMQISALIAGQKMESELLARLTSVAQKLSVPALQIAPGYEMKLRPL